MIPSGSKKHRRAGFFAKQRRHDFFLSVNRHSHVSSGRSEPIRAGIRSTCGRPSAGEDHMANRDVLAIGTSAGGVAELTFLAKRFPRDFPAAVLVTIHLPSHARPAIDPMLRSTALCCSGRAVGIVLTGTLGDGASGLWALRQAGGTTVVQDPKDAAFAEMPMTALNRVKPDHIVTLGEMPALLERLVHEPGGAPRPLPRSVKFEVEVARTGRSSMNDLDSIGHRSVLACPDCGGVMWEIDEDELLRYRCHVGHTYTAEVMSVALDDNLRRALASASRALEERVALASKLHRQAVDRGHRLLAENWADKAREFEREMEVIRGSIRRMDQLAAAAAEQPKAAE